MPVRNLRRGRWTRTIRADDGSCVPVPATKGVSGTRWFCAYRLGRPYYAKPLRNGPGELPTVSTQSTGIPSRSETELRAEPNGREILVRACWSPRV